MSTRTSTGGPGLAATFAGELEFVVCFSGKSGDILAGIGVANSQSSNRTNVGKKDMMTTRQLGQNGPHLSSIGLGAWAIGGPWAWGWGEQNDGVSLSTIHAALDAGINWVDTAPVYGLGHAESILARALEGRRDEVFIATKCGLVWDNRNRITNNLHPASIRRECEDSLRRLNSDYIDLYQIHWPHKNIPAEESWGQLTRLVEQGKVRYIGVSNYSLELLQRCQAIAPIQSLQPPYNLLQRDIEQEILPWCRENNIGVIGYSPMMSGLLTGKFNAEYLASLDAGDWRRRGTHPVFREPLFKASLQFTEQMRPLAGELSCTIGQLAVAWTLANPAITASIVGARTPQQAIGNAAAAGVSLSPAQLEVLDGWYRDIILPAMEEAGDNE